ncbi:MAG: 4'-phosphopantetheinyl transferase superfamily protein [Desulfobacterales bacterium]|jgi:4'-phosphopantetheinyl transferase|nr:4'-phosphopantetheinyl transferase superfamily protein [Desulfobacterales bacterium]
MTATITPVILPVPETVLRLPPADRARALSDLAREALALSAQRLQIVLGPLRKDDRGAPLPVAGHYWSLTHKPLFAAAVLAPAPVGLDLEALRPCTPALYRRSAAESEWALLGGGDPRITFFRCWTAKEAVLKAGGEGIRDWPRCRIHRVDDDSHLVVDYRGALWPVEQFFFSGHIASIAGSGFCVRWHLQGGR